jgi:hypothetical protein
MGKTLSLKAEGSLLPKGGIPRISLFSKEGDSYRLPPIILPHHFPFVVRRHASSLPITDN